LACFLKNFFIPDVDLKQDISQRLSIVGSIILSIRKRLSIAPVNLTVPERTLIIWKEKPMLKEKIGETAGTIWTILKERDEVSISSLPKILNETSSTVNQALGWLAREGKIDYRQEGRKTLISLAESEK